MATITKLASLDWPPATQKVVQCAGQVFVEYEARRQGIVEIVIEEVHENGIANADEVEYKWINLLAVSSNKLKKLTYYQCLGDLPLHATVEQVKKAYHKACLMYHPDKTGRGEEDEVFLKVKAGFDTLSDKQKRRAYDSQMPFDDSVPRGNESPEDFYALYGPCFARNLRFDDRLSPDRKKPTPSKNKKNKRKTPTGPPAFGDDETPLADVNAFYDYWAQFESWRDFSMQAAQLTNNQNFDADNVDSRYEKRFIQKEIDRKAKSLKRDEVARVNLLVERAMATDPRLRREKNKEKEEKERIEREKRESSEKEARETKERTEREAKENAIRDALHKINHAALKADKEKMKKLMRKAKATLRKLCLAAQATGKTYWTSMEHMYDDVEYLCEVLDATALGELSAAMGGVEAVENPTLSGVDVIQEKVMTLREGKSQEEADEAVKLEQDKRTNGNGNGHVDKTCEVWTEEQDSLLQEGLAKYPATMDKNERWDSIAKGVKDKSKKDCVDRFKSIREALKNKK